MINGRVWRVVRFGDPAEAMELQEVSWLDPPIGQVLVRVRAAGAGLPDLLMTRGRFPLLGEPPFGLGEEVAGDVVAVAPGSRFTAGDTIMGITAFLEGWGGYADYAYVHEQSAARVPASLSDEQAAGFPIGFRTAYAGLVERARLAAGEVLLVLGAAGSAGSAAVQLGRALGATVIAVAGSSEKADFCLRSGASHAINYKTADLTGEIADLTYGHGADLVYDTVGGDLAATSVASLARGGRIAIIGMASGATVELNSLDMLLRNYSAVGVLASGYAPDEDATAWQALTDLADRGKITTPVGTVYAFEDVPAMIAQQASPPPGKSVVRVRRLADDHPEVFLSGHAVAGAECSRR
ncbi:MAG TPA: NADPH:quinone oxidoreductase family protein [Streptosporangiaceae bacterium]